MPKGVMIVHTGPASAEREAEYNDWYDSRHLLDVLAVDGFQAGTRYKASVVTTMADVEPVTEVNAESYLTVYEVEADDFQDLAKRLLESGRDAELSDALQFTPRVVIYEQIRDRVQPSR